MQDSNQCRKFYTNFVQSQKDALFVEQNFSHAFDSLDAEYVFKGKNKLRHLEQWGSDLRQQYFALFDSSVLKSENHIEQYNELLKFTISELEDTQMIHDIKSLGNEKYVLLTATFDGHSRSHSPDSTVTMISMNKGGYSFIGVVENHDVKVHCVERIDDNNCFICDAGGNLVFYKVTSQGFEVVNQVHIKELKEVVNNCHVQVGLNGEIFFHSRDIDGGLIKVRYNSETSQIEIFHPKDFMNQQDFSIIDGIFFPDNQVLYQDSHDDSYLRLLTYSEEEESVINDSFKLEGDIYNMFLNRSGDVVLYGSSNGKEYLTFLSVSHANISERHTYFFEGEARIIGQNNDGDVLFYSEGYILKIGLNDKSQVGIKAKSKCDSHFPVDDISISQSNELVASEMPSRTVMFYTQK